MLTSRGASGKPVCMFSIPVTNQAGEFDGVVFLSILVGELDAWLHGRTPEHHKPAIAQDSKGFDLNKVWGAK